MLSGGRPGGAAGGVGAGERPQWIGLDRNRRREGEAVQRREPVEDLARAGVQDVHGPAADQAILSVQCRAERESRGDVAARARRGRQRVALLVARRERAARALLSRLRAFLAVEAASSSSEEEDIGYL